MRIGAPSWLANSSQTSRERGPEVTRTNRNDERAERGACSLKNRVSSVAKPAEANIQVGRSASMISQSRTRSNDGGQMRAAPAAIACISVVMPRDKVIGATDRARSD